MTPRKRRWLAASLGTGLVLLLLVLASLDTLGNLGLPKRFEVTEVATFEPPPPPPRPPARPSSARNGGSTGTQLTLRSSRAPVALDKMQLDVQFAAADVGKLNLAGLGNGIGVGTGDGAGDGSGGELALLSELDQQPSVVSAPVFSYPREATAAGIAEFDLEFRILIDEEGRTYPIEITKNPFPSLNAQFLDYVSKVRFTPPTRLGIAVRTEYLWPVRVKR